MTDDDQARLFEVAKCNPAWFFAYVAATLDFFRGLHACEIKALQITCSTDARARNLQRLARRASHVAVEIRRPLLELGEVLHAFQRALRPEQALEADSTQRRRVDAMPMLVGPDIADGMCGGICMAVWRGSRSRRRPGGLQTPPILGRVELLLRERCDEQRQSFELLLIEDVLEEPLEIVERDELALGYVAEVRPGHEEDGRRELGEQVVGQVEVEVETRQETSDWICPPR